MKEIVNDSAIANSVTATETMKWESTVNAVKKIDYMNVRIKDLLSLLRHISRNIRGTDSHSYP